MILDYEPGDKVTEIQTIKIGVLDKFNQLLMDKVTVNFENVGKKVINISNN